MLALLAPSAKFIALRINKEGAHRERYMAALTLQKEKYLKDLYQDQIDLLSRAIALLDPYTPTRVPSIAKCVQRIEDLKKKAQENPLSRLSIEN